MASPPNTGNKRCKACYILVVEKITTLFTIVETAMDLLNNVITNATKCSSSSRTLDLIAQAMQTIKKEEGLDNDSLAYATMVLANTSAIANVYLNMKN